MQAYKIIAKNTKTGQRIIKQFLDGLVITDPAEANRHAQAHAQAMAARSRDTWVGEIELYTVKN